MKLQRIQEIFKNNKKSLLIICKNIFILLLVLSVFSTVVLFFRENWIFMDNGFPFRQSLEVKSVLVVSLLLSTTFFFPMTVLLSFSPKEFVTRKERNILIIAGILGFIPVCLVLLINGNWTPERIIESSTMDQNHFFLTKSIFELESNYPLYYRFYRCNQEDFDCEVLFSESGGTLIMFPYVLTEPKSKQIFLFLDNRISYTYGPDSPNYKELDLEGYNDSLFYVYSVKNEKAYKFIIDKCDIDGFVCDSHELLPFHYSTEEFSEVNLDQDESIKELRMIIDGKLILTYDTTVRCVAKDCEVYEK
ncbi:MAG: hypothetical protein AB9891_20380 [Anaerolineaceae bacterium]